MTASSEPLHGYHPGLTLSQVASRLKISPSTARRWARSGRLPSTQVRSGEGFEYRVPVEALEGLEASTNPSTDPSTNDSMNGSTPSGLEASMERSTAMAVYNAQLLAPLVAVIERQAVQLVSQAGTIGRQSAELEAARAQISTLLASGATNTPDPTTGAPWRHWPRGWIAATAIVLVLVAVVVVLVVVR